MAITRWMGFGTALLVGVTGCGSRTSLDVHETHGEVEDEPSHAVMGLSAGGANTCVLWADRKVTCFGGMIGEPRVIPFSPAVEIAVGAQMGCVRTESGHVECVDISEYAMPQPLDPPVEIAEIDDAVQIAVGSGHACVLRQGGRVECWGDNSLGQLGDGSFISSSVPVPVGLGPINAVTAGEYNTCALTDAGVFCWGRGGYGALGNGSSAPPNSENEKDVAEPSPVQVVGLVNPRQVSAGLNAACAIDGPGSIVKCWGWNVGPMFPSYTYTPTAINGIDSASHVFAGYLVSNVIRSDGGASAWGSGYLGNGSADPPDTVVDVIGLNDVRVITGGWTHSCALNASGEVYCWGSNGFGQLGFDDKAKIVLTPTLVPL